MASRQVIQRVTKKQGGVVDTPETQNDNKDKQFDMLLESIGKVYGALRYKDSGFTIQVNGAFNNSGRFSVNLPSEIVMFPKADYEISLQSFTTEQNLPNITSTSNKFYFSSPTSGIQTITLPVGSYDINTLNDTIQTAMRNLGFYNSSAAATNPSQAAASSTLLSLQLYVGFSLVESTNKVALYIQYGSGYTVYFNQPNSFYNILGFLATDVFTDSNPTQTMTSNTTNWFQYFYSTNIANLNLGILTISFGCTLAKGSILISKNNNGEYTGTQTQIIASKPYIDPPGTIFALPSENYPYYPLWYRLDDSVKKIRQFDIFTIDNNLNPVSFGGYNFVMVIAIRQA
jgi:hypothetical protein